jgi:S1-C subfamily serine protease
VLLVTPNAFLNAAFLNFPAPANRVTGIRAASSAEKASFLKGDIISGLDDKAATAFTLSQLRDTFGRTGETHDVKVLRAGKRTSIAVTVVVVSIDQRPL